MSKINTRVSAGAQTDHEFTEFLTIAIALVAFISVSVVFAAWLAGTGTTLPAMSPEFILP